MSVTISASIFMFIVVPVSELNTQLQFGSCVQSLNWQDFEGILFTMTNQPVVLITRTQ